MGSILIFLFLLNSCFDRSSALTSKHTMDRLDYIEDRLNAESNRLNAESVRLNAESKFRKEEFSLLLNKVQGIEMILSKMLEKKETESAYSEIAENTPSDTLSNKIINILLKSFKAEKFENRRFKREILQDVNKQAELAKEADERVENSLDYIKTEMMQLKHETLQHHIDLEKVAQNTTALLNSTMQNTETILIDLNGTGELIKYQTGLHDILQTTFKDGSLACLNETRSLTKNVEDILKELKKHRSCLALYNNGFRSDGINEIHLQTGPSSIYLSVYCDMTTDGGGWTVVQRRQDGSEDFLRDWNDYKYGFGNLDSEFWLGNEYFNILTDDGQKHEVRIDLEDYEGNWAYANYDTFRVGPESTNYTLEVHGYTGNAGDSLEYHNGMQFTTNDRDNDLDSHNNCASYYNGAWWFNNCFYSHLNGVYNKQKQCPSQQKCVCWYTWKGGLHNMKFTEMKLR